MRFLKERPNLFAACVIIAGVVCILMLRVVLKLSRQDDIPLQVIALSAPTASLAMQVGERHVVVDVLERGTETGKPLDTSEQLARLRNADVILGIGAEQDQWALPLIEASGRRADYVELLHYVPTLKMPDGQTNPYVWYGPEQVKALGKVIRDALTQKDAVNGGDYHVRAHLLGQQMDRLQRSMEEKLQEKEGVGLLLFHQGFQYFFDGTPLGDNVYLISEDNLGALGIVRILGLLSFASGYSELYVFTPIHVPADILAFVSSVFQVELRFIPDTTVRKEQGGVQSMLESSLQFVGDAL